MEFVTELWKQLAPVFGETVDTVVTKSITGATEISKEQARDIVNRTVLLIEEQGYCLWTCQQLDGTVICLVKDVTLPDAGLFEDIGARKRLAMDSYPVYTIEELEMLGQASIWTDWMVLEVKRLTGAVVTKVDQEKEPI
jgi:hypothetical protein